MSMGPSGYGRPALSNHRTPFFSRSCRAYLTGRTQYCELRVDPGGSRRPPRAVPLCLWPLLLLRSDHAQTLFLFILLCDLCGAKIKGPVGGSAAQTIFSYYFCDLQYVL